MANLKVIKAFRLNGILQKIGDKISVDPEKAQYILNQGWAEGEIPKAKPKAKPKSKAKTKAKKKK